jgi:hypothetical protein
MLASKSPKHFDCALVVQNRSKWPARDRNVLAILMPESKWIEIDQTDQNRLK